MNHSPTARTRRERVKRGRRVLTRAAVINIKHAGLRMRWNVAPRGHASCRARASLVSYRRAPVCHNEAR